MNQSKKILVKQELEHLSSAISIFSQIQLNSLPAYATAIETEPITNYMFSNTDSLDITLKALKTLEGLSASSSCIDSLYLYNWKKGFLSSKYGFEGNKIPADSGIQDLLLNIHTSGLSRFILRKTTYPESSTPVNLISIVLGSMPPDGRPVKYAFIANISERKVRESLSTDNYSVASMYIINKDGIFVSNPDPNKFAVKAGQDKRFAPVLASKDPEGSMMVKDAKGTVWIASWKDQSEFKYRFVSFAKKNTVFSAILRIRNTVYIVLAAVLILAVSALYVLYRIEDAYQTSTKKALDFLNSDQDDAVPGQTPLLFTPKRFLSIKDSCLAAEICNDIQTKSSMDIETSIHQGLFIQNIAHEIVRTHENRYIILFKKESGNLKTSIQTAFSYIQSSADIRIGGYILSAAVSVQELPDAYHFLEHAFLTDYLRKSGTVTTLIWNSQQPGQNKTAQTDSELSDIPEKCFTDVDKAFHTGRKLEIEQSFTALFDAARSSGNEDAFKFALSSLSRRIPFLLGDDAELLLGDISAFQTELSGCRHIDQAEKLLKTVTEKCEKYASTATQRKKAELIQKIKDYIESNISDRSLCTAQIAAKTGLSTGYMRNLFKNTAGISLLDYIGTRRLDVAKEFLSSSDRPIRDICDDTGFINYSYFFTYFKKMTGQTPAEFRNKNKI